MTLLRAAKKHRSDARVAEGGALLRRYTGLNRYRGFESLSLRQNSNPCSETVPSAAAEPPGDTHLTWLLPSDGRSAGVARRHLEDVLAGMPAATVDTALLLTSEVVTNATAHGGGLVTLTVDLDGEGLRVEVCDESPRRPVPREESLLAEGGRGLHIVDALAADWGARPDKRGKKVWFRLPVPGRRGVR